MRTTADIRVSSHESTRLWQRSQRRFTRNVLSPRFEHVCRHWTRRLTPDDLFDEYPHRVECGTVDDPANKTSHELEVVAFGLDDDNRQPPSPSARPNGATS